MDQETEHSTDNLQEEFSHVSESIGDRVQVEIDRRIHELSAAEKIQSELAALKETHQTISETVVRLEAKLDQLIEGLSEELGTDELTMEKPSSSENETTNQNRKPSSVLW